jgi:hypothetical protein
MGCLFANTHQGCVQVIKAHRGYFPGSQRQEGQHLEILKAECPLQARGLGNKFRFQGYNSEGGVWLQSQTFEQTTRTPL